GAVIHEAAILGKIAFCAYRRQAMASRQIGNQLPSQTDKGVGGQDQPAIRLTGEALDRGLDVGGGANRNSDRLHAERWRSRLDRAPEEFGLGRGVRVESDGAPSGTGCGGLE